MGTPKKNILDLQLATFLAGNEYLQIIQPNGLAPPANYTDKKVSTATFAALANGTGAQAANLVFAGPPSGVPAAPTFRSLVALDIPNLDASKIATGTMATARLGGGVADATTFLRGDQQWVVVSAVPPDGSVTYAKIQNLAGLSVMGRASNSSGVGADITAALDFQVLRRSGAAIGFGAIDLSQSNAVTNRLAFANLTQGTARSVLGVTGNATADVASIQGTADQALVVNSAGTALAFGAVNLSAAAAITGDLPFANLTQGTARSVLGVTGNATADFASIQGTADQALVVNSAGTALSFGAVNLSAAAAITGDLPFANLTQGTARSVLGVTGNATADFASIQGTTDQVLVVNGAGTALTFSTVATGGIAAAAVTYAKIQNVAGLSVVGRSANSSGVAADITGTANQFLQVNAAGTTLGFVTMSTDATLSGGALTIANAAVTYAKFQNIAGMSVAGRSTNSSGVGADITGTTDQVLRVNTAGTALGFGSIATAGITDDAVTYAKIQNVTTSRLLGRATAGSGDTEEITLGTGLSFSGTTLNSSSTGAKQADQQTFTGTGTWTKPGGFGAKAYAFIQVWGGGGGGGRSAAGNAATGGGGGSYNERWVLLSSLGGTETVTIGGAGTAAPSNGTNGGSGGNTTFGTWITGYGGGGGSQGSTGACCVAVSGGSPGFATTGGIIASTLFSAGSVAISSQFQSFVAQLGGCGSQEGVTNTAGGNSVHGGGGGGGKNNATSVGAGTSIEAGNGGAAGVAGTAPSGGGGGNVNAAAGAGAAGRCFVTVFDGA